MTAATLFPFCWTMTRRVGFSAYSITSLGSFGLWLRFRRLAGQPGRSFLRLASLVGILELLLALDMVFEWRNALHTFCVTTFMKYNLYERRHSLQLELLAALGGFLLVGFVYLLRRFRSHRGSVLAISSLSLSLALWLMEIISLHETDSGLYHLVNGIMVIAYLWVATGLLTLSGVGLEARLVADEDSMVER